MSTKNNENELKNDSSQEELGEIDRYNFMHSHRLQPNQKKILTLIHENYAHGLEMGLSSFLKNDVLVKLEDTDQQTFSTYAETLGNPSFICIFYIERLNGYGLITVNPSITYSVVDRVTGGSGSIPKEIKPFTSLELAVTKKFVNLLIKELSSAWSTLVSIIFEFKQIQTNPFLINVITPQEVCVVIKLNVQLGDINENMTVCIPYSNVEPLMAKVQKHDSSGESNQPEEVKKVLQKNLHSVSLELVGILGEMELSVGELSALQPGDVLDLGKKRKDGVILRISDINKFKAHLGLVGKSKGVVIVENIVGDQ